MACILMIKYTASLQFPGKCYDSQSHPFLLVTLSDPPDVIGEDIALGAPDLGNPVFAGDGDNDTMVSMVLEC